LRQSEAELRNRYEKAKPAFEDADRRRKQIIGRMNNHRERLRDEVVLVMRERQREIASLLSQWVEECELKEEVSFMTLHPKQKVEAVASEVAEALGARIEKEQVIWQEQELQPVIEKHLRDMTDDVSDHLQELLSKLDNVMSKVTGIESRIAEGEKEISPLERVLAAAGGFVVGGVGSALVGGTMGFGEMMKSLGPQIALVIGMILVGLTNPFILVPVLLGSGILQGLLKQGKATTKTREKVIEAMANELRAKAHETASEAADKVFEQTEGFVKTVDKGLRKEINATREQVENALKELQMGEAKVNQKLEELDSTSKKLGALDGHLRDLMIELAAGRPL